MKKGYHISHLEWNQKARPGLFARGACAPWPPAGLGEETIIAQPSGRGRLPSFEMPLKAQLLEKGLFSYEKATHGSFKDYTPSSYQLGYQIVAYGRSKYGADFWDKTVENVARKPLFLTSFSSGIKKQTSLSKRKFYKEAIQFLQKKWREIDSKITTSDFHSITKKPKHFSSYINPVSVSNGSTIAFKTSMDDVTKIVKIDHTGEEELILTPGPSYRESLSAGGNLLCWAEIEADLRWTQRTFSVIKLYNFETKALVSLTSKSRFHSPQLNREGSKVAAVEVTDKNADQRGENIVEKTPNEKEVLIDCQDIWYTYPDGTEALKGVNLKIHKGDFLGLIGRNGSGKTTLAKIIKGLYSPTKGKVLVSGTDLFKKTGIDRAKTVGYVFQNPDDQIFSKTIRDEIGYGLKFLKLSKDAEDKLINKAATTMELQDHLDKNPFDVSQGLRQRVAIASVLIFEPEIFIIDEPTTGQDFARSKIIMDMVRTLHEIGKTIIIVTHDMELIAEYAKRLIVMKSGKMLLDGSTRNVFSQPKMLQESSIKPPQITSLGQALSKYSVPPDILTVEEMETILTIKKVS